MAEVDYCLVCRDSGSTASIAGGDVYKVTCPGCGTYLISGTASRLLAGNLISDGRQVANARGWLRENQGIKLDSNDVERLRVLQTPSVAQRAEKLLLALFKESNVLGQVYHIDMEGGNSSFWRAHAWARDGQELTYLLLQYLIGTKGWLQRVSLNSGLGVFFTPEGHDYLETLRIGRSENTTGFCAMWFNPEVKHIWTDAIQPAIKAAGYGAVRIDGVEHNNKIDDEILANIRASRFVVADFTGERGGVYFEAGFAMGLGRPVIWTVREEDLKKIHFDTRQYNFVTWQADKLDEFAKRLQLRIEATIGKGPIQI